MTKLRHITLETLSVGGGADCLVLPLVEPVLFSQVLLLWPMPLHFLHLIIVPFFWHFTFSRLLFLPYLSFPLFLWSAWHLDIFWRKWPLPVWYRPACPAFYRLHAVLIGLLVLRHIVAGSYEFIQWLWAEVDTRNSMWTRQTWQPPKPTWTCSLI